MIYLFMEIYLNYLRSDCVGAFFFVCISTESRAHRFDSFSKIRTGF